MCVKRIECMCKQYENNITKFLLEYNMIKIFNNIRTIKIHSYNNIKFIHLKRMMMTLNV